MASADLGVFEVHPDPMWVYDLETYRFLKVNAACLDWYGYSEQEMLGLTLLDSVPPEDVPDLRHKLKRLPKGLSHSGVWRHRRKDGSDLYGNVRSWPTEFEGCKARMVTVRDVTDSIHVEAGLKENTDLQRMAVRKAQLGAWRVNIADASMIWSEETFAIHGQSPDYQPNFEDGSEYIAPEHRARVNGAFAAAVRDGSNFSEIWPLITAQGERIWVKTLGEPVYDEMGEVVAYQGAIQDVTELIDAQDAYRHLSDRLQNVLESISEAFFTLDREWRFTYLNQETERAVNVKREEVLGESMWDVFPDGLGTPFEDMYRDAMTKRQKAHLTAYYEPLGKWLELTVYPIPEGLAVYFHDVTEQRAQQEQILLLEVAVSRLNDGVMITEAAPIDEPGPRIIYVNDALLKRTGYSREELIGMTPRILQGPRTDRGELDRVRAAMEKFEPVRAELLNYTKAGEELWLELDLAPIADVDGKWTHWVAVERDITDRKAAEAAVAESQERFLMVTRATNDVIWDWDLAQNRIWWNDAFQTMFGHDPEAYDGDPEVWTSHLHPDDRDRVLKSVYGFIEGTGTNWHVDYRFLRADGTVAYVLDRGFMIRDESGKAQRFVGSLMDVTEQRRLEDQLRQSQRLGAVGKLTGGVAHDFNNLLTVILGNAEMLEERLSDDQKLRLLAEMTRTAAERGAELTNRLLAFSRRQALDPKATDVNVLVSGMDQLLRRTLGDELDIEIVRGGGLWAALIDGPQLENALLNLCINARDAMHGGGRLTIEMANIHLDQAYADKHEEVTPGQYVMVAVSDTGTGMDGETLTRAFDPFFTTKDVGKGSGLGLSMVYGFVKQSRGHVRIYSEPGSGTTVKLYLPRAHQDSDQPVQMSRTGAVPGGAEKILVVEDDDLVRDHVSAQLADLGYRVISVENGHKAVEALKQIGDLDLLFTDVVMPGGMGGRQLAEEARRLRPQLPVLFTSGYTENAIVHHGRLDRGVFLLQKPYRKQELARKVRIVLDSA